MDRKDLTDISKCYLIQCQLPPMLSNALVAGDSGGISLRSQKSELCFALAVTRAKNVVQQVLLQTINRTLKKRL